jgi:hypothetical protein
MGEFLLDFKATGTEEFAKAAKDTTTALDRQEANARKMSKWRNELAQLARSERDAAEKRLPIEKQMETLLQRRVQLEERIARAGPINCGAQLFCCSNAAMTRGSGHFKTGNRKIHRARLECSED